ncbi:hypothetical protein H8E88_20100 [candidate division KSB1 bacterium]|nr:hypothetical protein [candidate division KSB1 bacterium]MBL7093078.1 hypothetical protein [candidate division KSB1 bacterium]
MNTILAIGTKIVIVALISYAIGIFIEQRKRLVTNGVLITLTVGIILDVIATVFMIIGSPSSPFTLHGFLGYSALAAMLIDTSLIWRFRITNGTTEKVGKSLHLYSRYAFSWWVIAFITGALLVVFK